MDPIDAELEAFFRATEAPWNDERFVWRTIEALERRMRRRALALTAVRAAGAGCVGVIMLALLGRAAPEAQIALADATGAAAGYGALLLAACYALRKLTAGGAMDLASL